MPLACQEKISELASFKDHHASRAEAGGGVTIKNKNPSAANSLPFICSLTSGF